MGTLPACISVPVCLVPREAKRGHKIPCSWSFNGCKQPCGYWEVRPKSLEEQTVFLISKSSLKLLFLIF